MQQQPEVRKKQTEGISNNLEAFTTKMTRSSSKNQEVPVSCDFLNRDRTREQRRIPHCKPCNGRSSRKCHSQTQTIPSKKASAGNCLPMPFWKEWFVFGNDIYGRTCHCMAYNAGFSFAPLCDLCLRNRMRRELLDF